MQINQINQDELIKKIGQRLTRFDVEVSFFNDKYSFEIAYENYRQGVYSDCSKEVNQDE